MRFSDLMSDEATLAELGRRVTETRLRLGKTQAQLAEDAGVSKRTVRRLEDGASVQLTSLIRCLRALGRLEGLDLLMPEEPVNPIELLERGDAARVRARPRKDEPPADAGWTWGEEGDDRSDEDAGS